MKPKRGLVWYALVEPYTYECWILIILNIPLFGGVLWLLYRYDRNVVNRRLLDCLWDTTAIVLWDGISLKNRSASVSVLLGIFMFGSFVIINFYFGEVTSFMTVKPYLWKPIITLDQFKNIENDMKYLVWKGSYEETLFDDELMKSKMHYIPYDASKSFGYNAYLQLKFMMDNPREYVVIGTGIEYDINEFFMDVYGDHDFHISSETLSLAMACLFFKKSSLYQEEFNIQMMRLQGTGIRQLIDHLYEHYHLLTNIRNARNNNRVPPLQSDKIKLDDMTVHF